MINNTLLFVPTPLAYSYVAQWALGLLSCFSCVNNSAMKMSVQIRSPECAINCFGIA